MTIYAFAFLSILAAPAFLFFAVLTAAA